VSARSRSGNRDLGVDLAPTAAQLDALRTIADELNVGIVLLDQERRVQFINRSFRRFWCISDALAESRQTLSGLLYQGRGITASTASHYLLGEYVAKQMDLIHTGEERPLHIRTATSFSSDARHWPTAGGF